MVELLSSGKREHLQKLLSLCQATFGDHSQELVAARHQHALALISAGEHAAAAEGLQECIGTYYRHGMQQACLLASMHIALGVALHAQERHDGAEECYLHAIDLVHEHFGREDPAASSAHSNLGALYLKRGDIDQAKRHFELALRRGQCIMGVFRLKLAAVHRCLAECHAHELSWAAALSERTKALRIYERQLGFDDERTASARVEVAHAHVRLRDLNPALGQLLKARVAWAHARDQPALLRVSRLLACVYCACGRYADAAVELRSAGVADADAPRLLEAVEVLAAASGW
jgi:tetratricopeptide (TPR) repeat protein